MKLNYQFVSPEKKVAIVILSPKGGIKCFCSQCNKIWRTAKHAILVVSTYKLYPGCDWFPGIDEFTIPTVGKFRWVNCFELIGPYDDSVESCARTESCRNHNEGLTPVLSTTAEAKKLKNEVLNSKDFKERGYTLIGRVSVTLKTQPKYNNGMYEVTD